MARKTYLDKRYKENIDKLIREIENGVPVKYACAIAGITEKTFYEYLNRAERDLENGKKNSPYIQFSESVKKAKAFFISTRIDSIRGYGDSDEKGAWLASAWLLERLYPEEFALKKNIEDNNQTEAIEYVNDVPNTTKKD